MKYVLLAAKLLIFVYLGYVLFFLATGYEPAEPGYRPPLSIFLIDTINLFIHEGGHFFLRPFGMFIYILGGSLVQCLLPLALVIVTLRQNISHVVYPGFWLGENLLNVSVYIQDAPTRKLKLIAQGLIHDWNWLLSGDLELASPLGATVQIAGLLICFASLVTGIWFAIKDFREFTLDYTQD